MASHLKLSPSAAYAAAQGIALAVDQTFSDTYTKAHLALYAGTRPATSNAPITDQVLLVDFELSKPAFTGDVSNSWWKLQSPAEKLAVGSGEASFFRIRLGDRNTTPQLGPGNETVVFGETVIEGTVTDRTGDGDLKIANTNVLMGLYVRVLQLIIQVPTDQSL